MKSTANPHNMHIGNRIARCRALRFPHMSKEKFCSYLCFYGLSKEKKFITRLEAGRRSIHDYELLILADALCVTVSDLLDSHSLDHLTPIEKKYPDSICAPPC